MRACVRLGLGLCLALLQWVGLLARAAQAQYTKGYTDITTSTPCPSDPFTYCDFFIEGSRNAVPMLVANVSDKPLMTPLGQLSWLRTRLRNDSFFNGHDIGRVEVDNSNTNYFNCPAPTGTSSNGAGQGNLANVFYSTNMNNQALIYARGLQNIAQSDYSSRCVTVLFGSMQIYQDPPSTNVFNLNANQDYTTLPESQYPYKRRCVTFMTWKDTPVCKNCPAKIANTDSKDLFPLSTTDNSIITKNCSDVTPNNPPHSHTCPIKGSCSFTNATIPIANAANFEGFYSGYNPSSIPYGAGRPVFVQILDKDIQSALSGNGNTNSGKYYTASKSTDASGCRSLCSGSSTCTGWLLVVPNSMSENPLCKNNTGGGLGYISQTGCNSDIITPYYGGCGYCLFINRDKCYPTCNNWGLDSTTAPNGTSVYWAWYGRSKCAYGKNDPHFVGAEGTRFEFNGIPDSSFCLLTDKDIHINMKMHGYYDDRTVGASILKNGKAVRTWMRELGIVWRKDDGSGVKKVHKLHLVARSGTQQDRGDGFLEKAVLDDVLLPRLQEPGETHVKPTSGFSLKYMGVEKYGPYDMDKYHISIDGLLELQVKLRVAHPLLQSPTDAETHFNVMFESVGHTEAIHGVVGQTYRSGRTTRSLEYRALSALLGHPVAADGETGVGYLDGTTEDYKVSSVLEADCKFTTFGL